jgi:hypothetical protein
MPVDVYDLLERLLCTRSRDLDHKYQRINYAGFPM